MLRLIDKLPVTTFRSTVVRCDFEETKPGGQVCGSPRDLDIVFADDSSMTHLLPMATGMFSDLPSCPILCLQPRPRVADLPAFVTFTC